MFLRVGCMLKSFNFLLNDGNKSKISEGLERGEILSFPGLMMGIRTKEARYHHLCLVCKYLCFGSCLVCSPGLLCLAMYSRLVLFAFF